MLGFTHGDVDVCYHSAGYTWKRSGMSIVLKYKTKTVFSTWNFIYCCRITCVLFDQCQFSYHRRHPLSRSVDCSETPNSLSSPKFRKGLSRNQFHSFYHTHNKAAESNERELFHLPNGTINCFIVGASLHLVPYQQNIHASEDHRRQVRGERPCIVYFPFVLHKWPHGHWIHHLPLVDRCIL